jgi:hypothetical protein
MIIVVIILLYFIYVTYYKQSFKDKLCVNCSGYSNISYSGPTANATGCNCNTTSVWCGNTGCHDYTDLLGIINFTNGSFEANIEITSGFTTKTPNNWTGSIIGTIFIILTPNETWGVPGTPLTSIHGKYVCALQNISNKIGIISQYFRCLKGASYTISFYVIARPNDVDTTQHKLDISIDGISYFRNDNLTTSWTPYSISFTATNVQHSLQFTNMSPNNSSNSYSVILDKIIIKQTNMLTGNTITNGDFEQDNFTDPYKYIIPTGWIYSEPFPVIINIPSSYWSIFTNISNSYICGIQKITNIPVSISQNMNMIIGKQYLISFYANIRITDNKLHTIQVYIDGIIKIPTTTLQSEWKRFIFVFIATNTIHTLKFSNNSDTSNGEATIFLDNITADIIC